MLDHSKPAKTSNSLGKILRDDLSRTTLLYFAPVAAVANAVLKAVKGDLSGRDIKFGQKKT